MKFKNYDYDVKFLMRCLVWLAILIVAMMATRGSGFVIVIPLILFAVMMNKPELSFFWLLVIVAAVVGNQYFMPKNAVFAISQRSLMVVLGGIMLCKIFGGRKHKVVSHFYFMYVYLAYMILPSAIGWNPIISYLKLVLFIFVFGAYLGVSKEAATADLSMGPKVRSAALAFAVFFIFGSVALIPFPGISQLSGEEYEEAVKSGLKTVSLFKGMTMHSQSMAPVAAGFSVLLFADMLFGLRRFDKLYCALLICCPVLLYMTSSRTGMGTYLVGMGFVAWLMMRSRGVSSRWRGRVMNLVGLMLFIMIVIFILTSSGRESVKSFAMKGRDSSAELSLENLNTRHELMSSAMENFKNSPMIGNGFQVGIWMVGEKRGSLLDYMSAPVEKGVWVTAILEEGGVVGMFLFLVFYLGSIISAVKNKAYIVASCMVMIGMTNLGEFTFFSMSYTGGILWAIVFAGVALDVQRLRQEQAMNNYYMRGRRW